MIGDFSPLPVKVLIETEKPNKSVKMEKSESEETGRTKETKTENGEANEQSEEMLLNRRGRPRKYGPNRYYFHEKILEDAKLFLVVSH